MLKTDLYAPMFSTKAEERSHGLPKLLLQPNERC